LIQALLWNGGIPPYGYRSEDRKLIVVPEEAEIIRRMFDIYKQTRSRTKVREELELMGAKTRTDKPFSKGTIEFILQNPIYAGKVIENDELFNGVHQAIISPELFFSVNEMKPLKFHNRKKKIDRTFLLKGLVRCRVHDCLMTPYYIRKKAGPIFYYLCTKKRQYRNLRADRLTC